MRNKMKKFVAFVGSVGLIISPLVASAAANIVVALSSINSIIGTVGPILMGLAFVFFVYNVVMFIFAKEAEAKDKARASMLQSILGFVCILGLYGIVNILLSTVGADNASNASAVGGNLPTFTF